MNTDTPKTDAVEFEVIDDYECGINVVSSCLARKLERERDEWKAKYIQQNKDLGCEMMDPNGTIWDHAQTLQRERDEAREEMIRWMSIAEGRGRTDEVTDQNDHVDASPPLTPQDHAKR